MRESKVTVTNVPRTLTTFTDRQTDRQTTPTTLSEQQGCPVLLHHPSTNRYICIYLQNSSRTFRHSEIQKWDFQISAKTKLGQPARFWKMDLEVWSSGIILDSENDSEGGGGYPPKGKRGGAFGSAGMFWNSSGTIAQKMSRGDLKTLCCCGSLSEHFVMSYCV